MAVAKKGKIVEYYFGNNEITNIVDMLNNLQEATSDRIKIKRDAIIITGSMVEVIAYTDGEKRVEGSRFEHTFYYSLSDRARLFNLDDRNFLTDYNITGQTNMIDFIVEVI